MRKTLTFCFLSMALLGFSQESMKLDAYRTGDHHFQVGIGYPNLAALSIQALNYVDTYTETSSSKEGSSFPKINISYDYALSQSFSIGPYFGYSNATTPEYNWNIPEIRNPLNGEVLVEAQNGDYQYRINSFTFGGRGLRHFNLTEKLDLYARGSVGFTINKVKTIGAELPVGTSGGGTPTIPLPEIDLSGHFGARYFFDDNWGAYGEVGYSVTDIIQAGVSYRILKKEE